MLSSTCSRSLTRRSILPPEVTNFRVLRPGSLSFTRNSRIVDSNLMLLKSSLQKSKITCFRQNESFSSENSQPEHNVNFLPEEAIRLQTDQSNVEKSSLLQVADRALRGIGSQWTVPWTAETILKVMLLWVAAFWFIRSWMVPFAAHIAGFKKGTLTFRGQALFSLLTDVAEGLAGVAILYRCLSQFRPLPSVWFKFSLKGNWPLDVLMGCLTFPLVNRLSQFNLHLLPLLPATHLARSSVAQSILARDPVAMALYATVVSVCAPVWEEIVFRGFLLPSLTKYMPVWCAVLVSSVAFALAHFNVQTILPLIFLGVVMGIAYTRSKNLLSPMVLHSLWNGFVFFDLMR